MKWICLLLIAASCQAQELLVCGWDEVYILKVTRSFDPPEKQFSWKAADSDNLPPNYREAFKTTDECKPLSGGLILITASSDGVAIIERATGRAQFWGRVPSAHSAEMLPEGKLVVAGAANKEGNKLVLFDSKVPEKPLFTTPFQGAHGVVWDEQRQRLWAVGDDELRSYRLDGWNSPEPSIVLDESFPLPDWGGHDLYAQDQSPLLGLTTVKGSYLFDRDKKKFSPHWEIPWQENVKSISIHPKTKQLVFVQAESPNWWASKIKFVRPAHEIVLPSERIYKARWLR